MFYYDSTGKTWLSKVQAVRECPLEALRYYYFDKEYSSVDWTVEPQLALDRLYLEQAQRIRDKYEYVVLAYSGGYDSTNILETFHYNGIKLDRIVIVGATSQDPSSTSDANHNGELYCNAYPYIEELGLTSITETFDYSKLFEQASPFSVFQYGSSWVDYVGGWFSPHNWFWRDAERHLLNDIGSKKACIIFGRDKPTLDHNGDFRFMDTAINSYGNSPGTDQVDRVNFYWDPTFPQLLVKQVHVMNRARDRFGDGGYDLDMGVPLFGGELQPGRQLSLNDLMYSLRKPLQYKSPKSKSKLLSLRDQFLKTTSMSSVHDLFDAGLQHLKDVGASKFVPITSRIYSIRKAK